MVCTEVHSGEAKGKIISLLYQVSGPISIVRYIRQSSYFVKSSKIK